MTYSTEIRALALELIQQMDRDLRRLRAAQENEVCSSIRHESKLMADGFEAAYKDVLNHFKSNEVIR